MRSYFHYITSHPRMVLITAALATLGIGVFVLTLERETGPDAFIPPDHPALAAKQRVDREFGLREPIAIGIIHDGPGGIFNPDTLRLIEAITGAVQELPGVEPGDVLSIATESGVYFEEGLPGFDRLLKTIPEDAEGLESLKHDILGYELYRGTLVAEDGSGACVLVRNSSKTRADTLYRELTRLLESPVITRRIVRGERLVVAGEAAVRAHMGVAVSDDAMRMNFICPVVMALLIILAYRTARGTLLPLCVIGGASAWALGTMAAAGVPIFIVTNGIFVIIMALGVADSLHLLGQYYEEQLDLRGRTRQRVIEDTCAALWFPLLVTSATDLAGFFALYLVGGMPPIRYFGLFTCVGVIGALVYSFTVIPAGLAMVPLGTSRAFVAKKTAARRTDGLDLIGRLLGRLGAFTFRRRGIVLAIGAVVIATAGWGASRVIINDARIMAFKDDHPIVLATNELNKHFDGTSHLNIVVTASTEGAILRSDVLRKIGALETFAESLPHVGGTHSVAGWIKRAHQKMHKEDPAYYAIPGDPDETRYYLDVLGDERTSPMAHLLGEVIDPTYTRTNLIVRMRSSEFIHQREVIGRLELYLSDAFNDELLSAELAGRVHLDYHWMGMIRTMHFRSVAFSVGFVLLLTGLMFRSVTAGLLCTLTVGTAVLVNYGVMGFFAIPLGVGTSMFASIAVGAGVNCPIHILDRLRKGIGSEGRSPAAVFKTATAFTGRALFFTAFVVAVGFLLLCVSEFRTLVRFGLLIGVGMIVSFVASVTLLPALVAVLRPRFVWRIGDQPGEEGAEQTGPTRDQYTP